MLRTAGFIGFNAALIAITVGCGTSTAPAPEPALEAPTHRFDLGPVVDRPSVALGFLTSGADLVTLWANGGLDTRVGSAFDTAGLSLHLEHADGVSAQLARYQSGETPYLRASWGAMTQQYETICPAADAQSCPQLLLQLGWSSDTHLVAREAIHSIADLKGTLVAVQRNGPHLELFLELLSQAGLGLDDVRVLWLDSLSGTGSPAESFGVDPGVAAAWVTSADLAAITSSPDAPHDAVAAVVGAHTLDTGAHATAECVFVRQDYAAAHPDEIRGFQSAWLHAAQDVAQFMLANDAAFREAATTIAPSLADGTSLLQAWTDLELVGLTGNVVFLGEGALGHTRLATRSLAFATAAGRPLWTWPIGVVATAWSDPMFDDLRKAEQAAAKAQRPASLATLSYAPDAEDADPTALAAALELALQALQGGPGTLVVRAHADPQPAVAAALASGTASGRVTRTGTGAHSAYTLDGAPLDESTPLVALTHPGLGAQAAGLSQAAVLLSATRAGVVRDALIALATERGLTLDTRRVVTEAVGLDEPAVALPRTPEASAQNRRVELVLVPTASAVEATPDYSW